MPAGRYVLLEFDDAAMAKAYVAKVNGQYGMPVDSEKRVRVRAVWAKPSKFCECTKGDRGTNPYRRGEKSGWWVHAPCGRPNRVWAAGAHWFSALGRNLLPGNTDHVPQGWGLDHSPSPKVTEIYPSGPDDNTPPGQDPKLERKLARRATRVKKVR